MSGCGMLSMRKMFFRRFLILVLGLSTFTSIYAQDEGNEIGERDNPNERFRWFFEQRAYPHDTLKQGYQLNAFRQDEEFKKSKIRSQLSQATSLSWTSIGPAPGGLYSGRVPAIAVHPTDGNTVYIGAADGGVWKTTNGGTSWTPLTDDQPSLASGCLAIDPLNPNVIYWGTGEPYSSIDAYGGAGILKSVDGGATWSVVGLTNEKRITRIAINPANPDILLAATWGGIYRSTNGGMSWTKTSTFSSGWDVAIDPSNPLICYAGASGVYKSTNGGVSWSQLTNGIPTSTGRLVLAIASSAPSTVYVLVSNTKFYKSTDAGASWTSLPIASDLFGSQGWYDITIGVSPTNPDIVLIGGIDAYYSFTGGNSWTRIISGQHPDCHSIIFGPAGTGIVYLGTDGGMNRSSDNGMTFTRINNNLAITQFYSVGLDYLTPLNIWGGTQDNGLQKSKLAGGLGWWELLGGDYGFAVVDYTNSKIAYATQANGFRRRIQLEIYDGMQSNVAINNGITENGAWLTPIIIHPDTIAILYTATTKIYRTTNQGDLWATTTTSFPWGSSLIRQLAIPRTSSQTLYASPGSTLYKSIDAGVTWSNVSTGLPGRTITSIVPHQTIPSRVYLTVSGSGTGHIFKSTDAGNNWTSINGNFPTDLPANSVAIDPSNDLNLYIGTDLGMWSTADGGVTWIKDDSFPNSAVVMLGITSDNYLVAATHGRSMFKAALNSGPFIAVTSPNGGENWNVGTTHNITWSQSGVTNVKIEYSTNNGSTWSTIISSTAAATGSYSWTVPNTVTLQGLVRISDAANASMNDISNSTFTIFPPQSVTVTSPNGGESWNVSSVHNITWTSSNIINIKIEYSTNNGSTWSTIVSSTAASTGIYSWTVPNTPTTQALVRISDASNAETNDISNAVFSIVTVPTVTVTAPNGGESWMIGSLQNITWTSANIANVKIEYSTNNGTGWLIVIASIPATAGSYAWTIPNTLTTQALIRVSDVSNAATNDVSNALFTIAPPPSITLTSPNGGESWNVLSSHNITWTSVSITNTKIEYSTNNGSSWTLIIASTPASTGSYSWTVPNTPTTQALMRVSDASNTAVKDSSDMVFTILTVPAVSVLSPNGGETWNVGSTQNITWASVNIANVKIEYSTDNGTSWSTITASALASTGSFSWIVSNTPSTHSRVRISDVSNASTYDISDAVFNISIPTGVTVTTPNGGEIWNVATSHAITWIASGLNNVRIKYSTNDGTSWTTVVSSVSASNGTYQWTVPNAPTTKARVMVSNSSGSLSDVSDAPFTITAGAAITLISPNGGERWSIGTTQSITWSSTGVSSVKLEYSTDAGSTWNLITSNVPDSSKSYGWMIPNIPTASALIRISDASNSATNDASNSSFTIAPPPSVSLLSPNGGEIWFGNYNNQITWISTSVDNVRIEYSSDNGLNWLLIEASVRAAQDNYVWATPDIDVDQALVRVSDATDRATSDQCDTPFKIKRVQFISTLICTDNGSQLDTLRFGEVSGATDSIDASYGETELSAKPPVGTFDVRWSIPRTRGLKLNLHNSLGPKDTATTYICELQPGPVGYPMTISWNALGHGQWKLQDVSTHGSILSFKMISNSFVTISDSTISSIEIIHSIGKSIQLNIAASWNLVSLPLNITNTNVSVLFPEAISTAFAYEGSYIGVESLFVGKGYWLNFTAPTTREIRGAEVVNDTIDVQNGWNLIGSISYGISATSVITDPPGIIASQLFGYDASYTVIDSIQPGIGFWVATNQNGKLILSSSAAGKNSELPKLSSDYKELNSLTFKERGGASQTLYFGTCSPSHMQHLVSSSELPPLPPAGVFDVRFGSDRMCEVIETGKSQEFSIVISSSKYPISVSWTLHHPGASAFLRVGDKRKSLATDHQITLEISDLPIVLELQSLNEIPAKFSLEQNFPNPFNPSTLIKFNLPEHGLVTLKVYNLLGQVAITLADQQQFDAGTHLIELDAKNLNSGIYFYQISVQGENANFLYREKMLLVK